MKHPAFNPYLPSWEYIPDGEPYVFGDRLYIFGSHDAFDGPDFCVNDYVCWSAPTDDLGFWRFDGIIYSSTQDPLAKGVKTSMNAPDVERGPDGRYYLFYQLLMQKATTVAVSDRPEGPYQFYGHIRHADGALYGSKRGDAYSFDPSVFTDDDGKIYMYTGSASDSRLFRLLMKLGGGVADSGTVIQLMPDMLTVIDGTQYPTVPGKFISKGTTFEGHAFYEASSMRKINGHYYLVYSSVLSHELCYAISDSPIGPFTFGGTLVSIGDIGLAGVSPENARNFTGNTHGGMACIHGQWYIFYHRQTNRQKCARQGCAEPVTIASDGHISQAEITSCGLNGGPLRAEGRYEARIACNLRGKAGTYAYVKTHHAVEDGYPYFTQSGSDRENSPDQYIAAMSDGSVAGFKYFDFSDGTPRRISIRIRGNADGALEVCTAPNGPAAAVVPISANTEWHTHSANLPPVSGIHPLYFRYRGTGAIDFDSFNLEVRS